MALAHQFLGQIEDDPLGSAVEPRRAALDQRRTIWAIFIDSFSPTPLFILTPHPDHSFRNEELAIGGNCRSSNPAIAGSATPNGTAQCHAGRRIEDPFDVTTSDLNVIPSMEQIDHGVVAGVGRAADGVAGQDDAIAVVDGGKHRGKHADIGFEPETIRVSIELRRRHLRSSRWRTPNRPHFVEDRRRRQVTFEFRHEIAQAIIQSLTVTFAAISHGRHPTGRACPLPIAG